MPLNLEFHVDKTVKFLSYRGDKTARFFLEHALWAAGETRTLTEEAASRLADAFPDCFKITDPKSDDSKPSKGTKGADSTPAKE